MKNMFGPNKPLVTCSYTNCRDCMLNYRLQCHFNIWVLLRFLAIAFPAFIFAGIGIARVNALLLLPWVVLAFSYFGFIEIRVMCSHCPHYAEPETKSLQCWANYGSPNYGNLTPVRCR